MSAAADPCAVLDFWFGASYDTNDPQAQCDKAVRDRWFEANAETDAEIAHLFGSTLERLSNGQLATWCDTPRGRLAYIVVADQFSRNIHRGSAAAFATDTLALNAARAGIELGHDAKLTHAERSFFYMPFEHSEAILDQHAAVGLFMAIRDASTGENRNTTGNNVRWAQQHRDIIVQFGRFPHRNGVLGRNSTKEELVFMKTASGFGQA